MRFLYVFTLLLLTTQWSDVFSDDSFECCMAGWKRVGSVDICSAPCCPGYREVVEKPPYLQAVSFCVKGFIASAEIQNSKSIIQNPKSKNLAPKPITNSSDSFTNLEFQIYEFFNEFLLWFLFQVANWKKKLGPIIMPSSFSTAQT